MYGGEECSCINKFSHRNQLGVRNEIIKENYFQKERGQSAQVEVGAASAALQLKRMLLECLCWSECSIRLQKGE